MTLISSPNSASLSEPGSEPKSQPGFQIEELVENAACMRQAIMKEVRKAVVGQEECLDSILCGLLAGGHVLLEGVPGVAKTLMVRVVSKVLEARFRRIQFTPDLMPADILGTSVFDLKQGTFSLIKGPIFSDLVLADEINRAPAKTQAALLEAMQERSVTLEGVPHALSPVFTVFATENPIDSEGTYPLPEAQLDRFLLKIEVGYPQPEEEDAILERVDKGFKADDIEAAGVCAAVSIAQWVKIRQALSSIQIEPSVRVYVRQIVCATRSSSRVRLGAGPRAAVHLLLAAKARAVMHGRTFVTPDDVRSLSGPVLRHRLLLSPDAEIDGIDAREVLDEILASVEVPR